MASISERLMQLVDEYGPRRLIILGDLVHDKAAAREAVTLLQQLAAYCEPSCWIMPAFSPWASGTPWMGDEPGRMWLCTAERVLRLPDREAA